MKNVKKYIGLLAGTLAVTVIAYGGEGSSSETNDNPEDSVTTFGVTQTNDYQVTETNDMSAFRPLPRSHYIVIAHEFIVIPDEFKLPKIYDILTEKGFYINDESFETPLDAIGRYFLDQNGFMGLQRALNGVANKSTKVFSKISQYLHKPIILIHHMYNYIAKFSYTRSQPTKTTCMPEEIKSLLEKEMYNDVIFIYLDEFYFYHIVIPPNKQ